MAVTIDLTTPDQGPTAVVDPAGGADLVLVRRRQRRGDARRRRGAARALLDAQHYTRGLAFLRPGTPTNNTPEAPAAFPPPDPGGSASFAVERAAPLVGAACPPGASGLLVAQALGLPLASRSRGRAPRRRRHRRRRGRGGDERRAVAGDARLRHGAADGARVLSGRPWPPRAQFWVGQRAPRRGRCPPSGSATCPTGCCPPSRSTGSPRQQAGERAARAARPVLHPGGGRRPADHRRARPTPTVTCSRCWRWTRAATSARVRVLLGLETTTNTAAWLGPARRRGPADEPERPRGRRDRPARHHRAERRQPARRPRREPGRRADRGPRS